MRFGDVRIFGGDADMAPAARIVLRGHCGGLGDRQAAMADAEIDRGIKLRIIEFRQHVRPDDAKLRGTVCDEGGDVERADADQVDAGIVGREAQGARILVAKGGFGNDSGAFEQRNSLGEDAALGHGDDDGIGHIRRALLAGGGGRNNGAGRYPPPFVSSAVEKQQRRARPGFSTTLETNGYANGDGRWRASRIIAGRS